MSFHSRRSYRWQCAALAALASILVYGCKPRKPAGPPTMPPASVTVSKPVLKEVVDWDSYPGRIAAVEMVEVRARVSGYLESIHFKDGAEVSKGDLLFVIDPRPYRAELEQRKANLNQMQTRLELASNDLARADRLLKVKAISEEEADARNKALRESEAALHASRATLQVAELNLNYTEIKAPISGRISRKMITEGNLVTGGQGESTLLTTIVSMDPVYCYFDADERAMQRYLQHGGAKPGASLQLQNLRCELQLASETNFPHKGVVDFVENQVDPNTGTLRMRGIFENAKRILQPGYYCRVRVPASQPYLAMLLPAEAMGTDQSQNFVYVLGEGDTAQYRVVKVGSEHNGMRVIQEGLTTNDLVIVNGLMSVRPGAKVAPKRAGEAGQIASTNAPAGNAARP